MDTSSLLGPSKTTIGAYQVTAEALDNHCNSVKVSVTSKTGLYFEETISIYDLVDVRKKLKQGSSLQEINQMSLLFLKLMLSPGSNNPISVV